MTRQTLFAIAGSPELDLERTGGLHVAADGTFAAATRLQFDETSWVDHVQGWLAGGLHVAVQLPPTPTHTGRWNRPGLMPPPEA